MMNLILCQQKKKGVMVFGPSGPCEPSHLYLGPLADFVRPTVSNLGFKMDSDFELDRQISAVVKSSFFQIRQLAKVKPFLMHQHFARCTLESASLPRTAPVSAERGCSPLNWSS